MTKWGASYNGATHNVTISNDASVATFPTPLLVRRTGRREPTHAEREAAAAPPWAAAA